MKKPETSQRLILLLKVYLFPGVLFVISLAVLAVLGYPALKNILHIRQNLEQQKTRLAALTLKAENLSRLDKNQLYSSLQIADAALPDQKSIPGLLAGLESLASQSGAKVTAFEISPGLIGPTASDYKDAPVQKIEVPGKSLTTPGLPFTLALEGNYQSLKEFLTKIKRARRILGLLKVSFVNQNIEAENQVLKSTLTMLVFYLPVQNDAVSLEAPLRPITQAELDFLSQVENFEIITLAPALLPAGKDNPFAP